MSAPKPLAPVSWCHYEAALARIRKLEAALRRIVEDPSSEAEAHARSVLEEARE